MATVSDLTTTPLSGLNHIDALLDKGPDWNFLTKGAANTILYTFSISSANEKDVTGQEAFTLAQQLATRTAFSYLKEITGINFVETAVGTDAQIHLANLNLEGVSTTGLCSWTAPYTYDTANNVVEYDPDAYVYLDNVEWRAINRDLAPGGTGYQTLLHELGHALGLAHPFHQAGEDDHIHLPTAQDNTSNTLMSYTNVGGPYSEFSSYDIAALNWLYGGDGLRGALGINSAGGARYVTGTAAAEVLAGTDGNDVFEGMGGSDVINGGAGTDTVVFGHLRSQYSFSEDSSGQLRVAHASEGTVTLTQVEQLRFTDGMYQRNQVLSDTTPPAAPVLAVQKNSAGYLPTGATPVISGQAEANALVRVYAGEQMVAETRADATGIFSVVGAAFANGQNYVVRATATDGAGNVSALSDGITFSVDAIAPSVPTSTVTMAAGGNQPVFSGTGEAGTLIQLVRISDATEIGRTKVKADGSWVIDSVPLPNGVYEVAAVSVDVADNATSALNRMNFTINSALNQTGNGLDNQFTLGAGNNAVDGMEGLDTVVYNGARDGFLIERGVYGVSVTDLSGALGTDNLVNVERIQFGDTMVALDVDGAAGQMYRLYRAAYDREPDPGGLKFWIDAMDTGNYSVADIAGYFLRDKEAQALYSTDPSDEFFITKLYHHVLHREPEGEGYQYWLDGLKLVSRAEALAFFSESTENQAQVIGSIDNGIEYPLPPA